MSEAATDVPVNQVTLAGVLLEKPVLRATPNGRSVLSLELEHLSPPEASGLQVACRITVVTLDDLAQRGRSLQVGVSLRVSGRLNQRRWIRDGATRWGRMEILAEEVVVISAVS